MKRLALGVLLACSSASLTAAAEPTKRQCIDKNAEAQLQLRAGTLRIARTTLAACAVKACPASVRKDCAMRLEQLEPRIPSLVLEAKDRSGHDLVSVQVRFDDEMLVTKLDGLAVDVDPGEHTLTFEAPGEEPVVEKILVHESEQSRHVRVMIGKAPVASTVPSETEGETVRPTSPRDRGATQRTLGVVVGGAGLAGVVAGTVVGLVARSR